MRALIISIFCVAALALSVRFAYVALLSWEWFSLMYPQTMGWGSNLTKHTNFTLGVITLVGWALSRDEKINMSPAVILTLLFILFVSISQVFSLRPNASYGQYMETVKLIVIVLIFTMMTNTKVRIHAALWVLILSVGYYGFVNGLITISTAGSGIRVGPPGTMIYDNNHFGIALATTIPIMHYMYSVTRFIYAKAFCLFLIFTSVIAVFGTHSRGAFVALGVFGLFIFLKMKRKGLGIIFGAITLSTAYFVLPAEWFERMDTIQTADEDGSFMGRVRAWEFAYRIAMERPLVGAGPRVQYYGQNILNVELASGPKFNVLATHNAFLEILGSYGFVAFFIFLSMFAYAYLSCRRVIRYCSASGTDRWAAQLARMLQVSILVFCVGASSVSLEIWLGIWIILAVATNLSRLVLPAAETSTTPIPYATYGQTR